MSDKDNEIDPNIIMAKMDMYEVNYRCPVCGEGVMLIVDDAPVLLTEPAQYLHMCSSIECDHDMHIALEEFPRLTFNSERFECTEPKLLKTNTMETMESLEYEVNVMQKASEGASIQYSPDGYKWYDDFEATSSAFNWEDYYYRVKKEPLVVWVAVDITDTNEESVKGPNLYNKYDYYFNNEKDLDNFLEGKPHSYRKVKCVEEYK